MVEAKVMAEEIRIAARRIRHVAAMLPAGPWSYNEHREIAKSGIEVLAGQRQVIRRSLPEVCRHVALWDPIVAELVAAQLDLWAVSFDDMEWINTRPGDARTRIVGLNRHEQAALNLARAINAESAGWPCCDSHNVHCEPPSELCCGFCTEVCHPEHAQGAVCVLEAARAAADTTTGVDHG